MTSCYVQRVALLLLVPILATCLLGQRTSNPRLIFKGQQIAVMSPRPTSDDVEPTGPARVCLMPSRACFTAPTQNPPFGFSPQVRVVHVEARQEVLLFTVVASAGGSGSLMLVALLDLRNGRLENLLPDVTITEQGEYKLWAEPSITSASLVVTANALWGDGESHFARHRFNIRTYALGAENARYYLRDQYVTSKKYPSLDEADKINVLDNEKREILQRLQRQQ